MGVAVAHLYLGVANRRLQDWKAASDHLHEALAAFSESNVAGYVAEAQTRLLEVEIYGGKVDREAITAELSARPKGDGLRPRVLRVSALAHHLAANHEAAFADMHEAAENSTGLDRAIALRGLAHVAPKHPDLASWKKEAQDLLDGLNVERIAAFPG